MRVRPASLPSTAPARAVPGLPLGGFVDMDGETHYRIASYQGLAPFMASIPSDSDLWMFITSGGGLTAGRVDADGALFPFRTVDQLHESHHHTGPLTLVRAETGNGRSVLWEPFAPTADHDPQRERNLYKNAVGNRLVFEEINRELDLAFRYVWSACDEFGWVRTATLENFSAAPVRMQVLDGLRNILPFGAPLSLYQQASNLVDAYKTTEVDPATGLGIFSLTAGITDRAEAVEVLRANTVWCCGLGDYRIHLSLDAVEAFRRQRVLAPEQILNGARGNYFVSTELELPAGQAEQWHLAGDTGRDHQQIARLRRLLMRNGDLPRQVTWALAAARDNLRRNVASSDGLQLTRRDEAWTHHFANVLFNNMRGGAFAASYDVPLDDLPGFLQVRNRPVAERRSELLGELPAQLTIQELRQRAGLSGDADMQRLSHEYLPLHFGRRHGDPSRPWNRFEIHVRDLRYEGNWRDIFQNWEALGAAFPDFLPNFVAKFVNAMTVDGYNPYRINRDGVDWEEVNPEDPWSNIGYWGDHQIIYLLKLLEAWDRHHPSGLDAMLDRAVFSYADVPYRIKPYEDILADPAETIDFDAERAELIAERVAARGTDGKLVTGPDGEVYHVNLLEKLVVPALAKLSNLIPDAGVWMNTQRPEWNDANNALAAGGVSMVTLCYLRRYLAFLDRKLAEQPADKLPVSREVLGWFEEVEKALDGNLGLLAGKGLSPRQRRTLLDSLGRAFSDYRATVYAGGFSGLADLGIGRVRRLFHTALRYLDWGMAANRREDGLMHTYNLARVTADGIEIRHLPVMLEGQVAALSAGTLDTGAAAEITEKLFSSPLYRPDQHSFMLYPDRQLPRFLERNAAPAAAVESVGLLQELVSAGNDELLARDADGVFRFRGDFRNAQDVQGALDRLAGNKRWSAAVARDRAAVLEVFEDVFHHQAYTGRSGTMYGYEGLGCIYWHMVAKLLLAVQENYQRALAEGDAEIAGRLADLYYRVRAGIGYQKSVTEYGAFPTDPYSHTPPTGGAKQPGMTGQVKEEILTRLGELGVTVSGGRVRFAPTLLEADEYLEQSREFRYFDLTGQDRPMTLSPGSLAFTLCQVPVVYESGGDQPWIRVHFTDGQFAEFGDDTLTAELSRELFARTGRIEQIRVGVPAAT
jgi:hypothetical protein